MKKALCSASLLICVLVLTSFHEKSDAAGNFVGPRVIAKIALKSAAPVDPTILFTPPQTGVYRISGYMTMITSNINGISGWVPLLNWSDDAGAEQAPLLTALDNRTPPSAWALSGTEGSPGPFTFEAVGGVPVTYSMLQPGDIDGGTYELFLVVERLE